MTVTLKRYSEMVPYHEPSALYAQELAKLYRSKTTQFAAITTFLTRQFRYDYVRAITIPKKNGKPDVPRTWEKKMGICLDIASLATGMLRAVDIDARMCVGKANRRNHAWVEAKINGKLYRYDHDGKAATYKTERYY